MMNNAQDKSAIFDKGIDSEKSQTSARTHAGRCCPYRGIVAHDGEQGVEYPTTGAPENSRKVMQAVRAAGYIPNALAGGLASRRSKLIAVVVPQINNNMFVDTIQSLSDELAERGYHILLCVSGYTPQTGAELVATLLSRRPDGVSAHRYPSYRRAEKGDS